MNPFTAEEDKSVASLGELGLLGQIRQWLGEAAPPPPAGMGDDCAVLEARPNLITTDSLIFGRHFNASASPEQAGAKLLKRNLSDIAAMGGAPTDAVLAMFLPRNVSLAWIKGFTLGIARCAVDHGVRIAGGDLAESDGFLAGNLTLTGYAERPLLRTGARVGDHVYVSGVLGGSILGKHLRFEPRLHEGRFLAGRSEIASCIDLTDGISKDLLHLLQDDHAAELEPNSLPLNPDLERTEPDSSRRIERMLSDGEDYELLFTVRTGSDLHGFEAAWRGEFKTRLSRIGKIVVRGGGPQVRDSGGIPLCVGRGYEHFR